MTLERGGNTYKLSELKFEGWTEGDGTTTDGCNVFDYFDHKGVYSGPDSRGIEPVFARTWTASEDS